mmetsp:Transcript_70985/g.156626  ORF Transcript_70985/g.156626 Transcript_70985/m.156626 type:complete len:210 (-) Transcript_70985:866-1495(-)
MLRHQLRNKQPLGEYANICTLAGPWPHTGHRSLHDNSSHTGENSVHVSSCKAGCTEPAVENTSCERQQSDANERGLTRDCSCRSCHKHNGHPISRDRGGTCRSHQGGTLVHRNAPCSPTTCHKACGRRTRTAHRGASPQFFHSSSFLETSRHKADTALGDTWLCKNADCSSGFAHKVHHRTIALGHHTLSSLRILCRSDSGPDHRLPCI